MKLKEIPRTATFAWSPDLETPTMFTGTASGTIDSNFDTSMALEMWKLNFLDESANAFTPQSQFRVETDASFQDLAVSENGLYVAGALENGNVIVWNAKDLSEVGRNTTAHKGAVLSISFSRKDPSKFATGGSDGQVLIWHVEDLSNPLPASSGMGQSHDEIKSVSWNNNAPHILASGGSKGIVNIWDTKKRKDVIHLSYTNAAGNRVPFSSVQWHPTNSTKIATSCNDDNEPVICIWDLKNVNSPEKILKGHTKGVLSLDWCRYDENLLLSGGRDDSTRLWNPVQGVELGSYPLSVEWSFRTKFHPTLPDILASASFEGKICIQSLQDTNGGTNKSASASNEDFWDSNNVMDVVHPSFKLTAAPKWLFKPAGATFGFGGKLSTVSGNKVLVKSITDSAFDLTSAKDFSTAFNERDFKKIVDNHKEDDESWKLLSSIVDGDDVLNLNALNGLENKDDLKNSDDDDEFNFVPQYSPRGDFKLIEGSQQPAVIAALLNEDWDLAVTKLIDAGLLEDALFIASYGDQGLVARAQNAYLSKYAAEKSYLRAAWDVSNKDVFDLVENAELSAWPAVLKYALKQPNETTRSSATAKISDKLRSSGDCNNALKASLLGKNTASAASIWLEDVPKVEEELLRGGDVTKYNAHITALQSVVEKITVAASLLGLPRADAPDADKLYTAIRDFADLASQHGDLQLAKLFLDMLPAKYDSDKTRVNIAVQPAGSAGITARRGYGTRASASTIPVPGGAADLYAPSTYDSGAKSPMPSAGIPGVPPTSAGVPPTSVPGVPGVPVVPPTPAGAPPTSAGGNPAYLPRSYTPSGNQATIQPPFIPQNAVSPARASLAATAAAANDRPGSPLRGSTVPPPKPAGSGPTPQILSKSHASGWNDITGLSLEDRSKSPSHPTRAAAVNVAPPQVINPVVQTQAANTHPQGRGSMPPPPGRAGVPPRAGVPRAVRASGPGKSIYEPPANHAPPSASGFAPPSVSSPVPPGASSGYVSTPPPGRPRSVSRVGSRASSVSQPTPVPPPAASSGSAGRYTPVSRPGSVPPPPPAGAVPAPAPVQAQSQAQAAPHADVRSPVQTGSFAPPPSSVNAPAPGTPNSEARAHRKVVSVDDLPEYAKHIYVSFQNELERVRPVIEAQYAKQYKDTARRLQLLYDALATGSLISQENVNLLNIVATYVANRNYDSATDVVKDISIRFENELGEWMTGVKRLIKMGAGVAA